ncbi:hypothetical protein Pmani_031429 [Petrolisthes manimaculis]|uniref:Uncharacterized protein n=1 Tax=Petrolisthes manimaculis TaxID=1843537 RepID=A0AAE1TSM7_9EUCA|nr:hypothetical protein Pmani_031429 [Petrolisthes manimaculis]
MNMLAGKIAIITGASSGIGAATAIKFSQLGATLCITGRNADNLKSVAEKCSNGSGNTVPPLIVQGDVTKDSDTHAIVDAAVQRFGRLDILVNNAGILELGGIDNTSMEQYDRLMNTNIRYERERERELEQYDRLMNTNIRSMYQLTMLATPHLINTKGNIVNVSSVNGIRAFPGVLAYCVSKAAVDQFTKCVALELASKQVRVNSVNPGVVVTELQKRGGLSDDVYAQTTMTLHHAEESSSVRLHPMDSLVADESNP